MACSACERGLKDGSRSEKERQAVCHSRKEGVVRDMERGIWGKVVLCERQLKRDTTSF